jgi:hypothetical protein
MFIRNKYLLGHGDKSRAGKRVALPQAFGAELKKLIEMG